MRLRVFTSTSAAVRIGAAREFLRQHRPGDEAIIVGASRGAADDLARDLARHAGAIFGLYRFSLTQLAARIVAEHQPGARRLPGTQAGAEAVAARAAFEALGAGELAYFAPVASMPGFPRALARTVHEPRLAGITPEQLSQRP